ncbi:MAG: alanine racemase [Elusimicrobiaceae bacterium]|nr:alanine racemase [Elusimicrobiaceae bacterium]
MTPILRPTVAEIDLTKLTRNLRKVRSQVGETVELLAILKANAYGHGAEVLGRFIEEQHLAQWLGVASVEEGMVLRQAGLQIPILVLGSIYPFEAFEYAIKYNLAVTIASLAAAQAACSAAEKMNQKIMCHVKQDTGMGRIGTRRGAVIKVLEYLHQHPWAILDGLYSHLSSVQTDPDYTQEQIGYLRDTLTNLQLRNIPLKHIHLAASAALTARPDIHYTLVRPGHSIYGLESGYEPILTLKTRIVYVKEVAAGASISYNRSFRSKEPMRVATLPLGYGDGYMRALSNKAEVLIGGKRCRVLGNITMDMLMVDISRVPQAGIGDEVVVVGRQGDEEITLSELADLAGTIDYEICTQLNARVPRIYKK